MDELTIRDIAVGDDLTFEQVVATARLLGTAIIHDWQQFVAVANGDLTV